MDRTEKKIALNKQIEDIASELKEKASEIKLFGKDTLIIGGIVLAGYMISRIMADDDEEVKTEAKSGFISSTLKGVATSMLLAIAKQKLTEYLEQTKGND